MKHCIECGCLMDDDHDGDVCECCQDDRSSEEEDESLRLKQGGGKVKVYISGPITGTKDYMERFSKAQKYLESLGCSVINPTLVNFILPKDTTYEEYMAMDLTMLAMCDAIYLLKGYEDSKGALIELNNAKLFGCKILYEMTPADMYPRLSRLEVVD